MSVKLPKAYKPSSKEPYMNPTQLEYFRLKLLAWRAELLEESQQTINHLREDSHGVGDEPLGHVARVERVSRGPSPGAGGSVPPPTIIRHRVRTQAEAPPEEFA